MFKFEELFKESFIHLHLDVCVSSRNGRDVPNVLNHSAKAKTSKFRLISGGNKLYSIYVRTFRRCHIELGKKGFRVYVRVFKENNERFFK